MNNITSEIFKKKEVRQCQKRGKDKVWWDLRGRRDPFCREGGWGCLGGGADPGDEGTRVWPLQRAGLAEGPSKRWALVTTHFLSTRVCGGGVWKEKQRVPGTVLST